MNTARQHHNQSDNNNRYRTTHSRGPLNCGEISQTSEDQIRTGANGIRLCRGKGKGKVWGGREGVDHNFLKHNTEYYNY